MSMTKQELAIYFGERRNVNAKPKDLEIVGNWIFWRNPEWAAQYPDDIELYHYPCGSVAECYDEIRISKTPFNRDLDPRELKQVINNLDKKYKKFSEDMELEKE